MQHCSDVSVLLYLLLAGIVNLKNKGIQEEVYEKAI